MAEERGREFESDGLTARFRFILGLESNDRQAAALTRLQKTYVRKTSEYVVSPHSSLGAGLS